MVERHHAGEGDGIDRAFHVALAAFEIFRQRAAVIAGVMDTARVA